MRGLSGRTGVRGVTRLVLPLAVGVSIGAAAPSVCGATTITEFSSGISAKSGPDEITAGPDGNLWFTEDSKKQIGRITPAGVVNEFSAGISNTTTGIATGPDGNLWFTEFQTPAAIGRSTPGGAVTEFALPSKSQPSNIIAGPDGNLWFCESGASMIGRITPSGIVKEFATPSSLADPRGIVLGSDGNLWFAERNLDRIVRMTPSGVPTEFSAGITPGASVTQMTLGPDGNVWFTEPTAKQVGRITPAGVVTEFPIGEGTNGIAAGPDGNLWYTTYNPDDGIGRISPAGVASELSTSVSSSPGGITPGSDGNMWFTMLSSDAIGRATVDGPLATTGLASAITPATATVAGTVDPRGASVPTSYHFEYGTTSAYGQSTPSQILPGSSAAGVTTALTGLAPGAVYHYRLVTSNAVGTGAGSDQSLTTLPNPLTPTLAPAIAGVTQSHTVWRAGSRLASFSRAHRPPIGTRFSFTLNQQARVTFTFTRSVPGRRVKGRCVAPSSRLRRGARCKRTITAGTLALTGHAGVNHVAFQGRISRSRRLRPGRYALTIKASSAGGTSAPATLRFTIVGG